MIASLLAMALAMPQRELAPHQQAAEVHRVATDDGSEIALLRYPGAGPPVVLCHGISSNHNFWDLDAERSLARWLAERGYDVWNLDRRARAHLLRSVVSPLYRGEMRQLAQVRAAGDFRSADGAVAYVDALARVRVPMLFVAGRADRVSPPDAVRAYYEAVGSADKAWLVASVANGCHADYGHLDLGVGDGVVDDVFSPVQAWIEAHR